MSARRKDSWVPFLIVAIALVLMIIVGAAAAGVYYIRSHFHVEKATAASARSEFEQARQAFAGKKPLLEFHDGDVRLVDNGEPKPGTPKPDALHVLTWDPDEDRIVRLSIPFWLLRLKSGSNTVFTVDGRTFDARRLKLRVEDIERRGPGLILDYERPRGERVLVWAQ